MTIIVPWGRPEVLPRYEVPVRESPDELTLGAEEAGAWKSCINVDHMAKRTWSPPLVGADWHAFCQALYKGIEGEDWRELFDAYKEMSRAVGVKKPQEVQKAKAIWTMKAAKDAGEEYYDPTREDILGRNKKRLALWEERLKDPIVALDKALTCVENSCWKVVARVEGAFSNGCCWLPPKFVGKADLGGRLALLGTDGQCVFTHSVHGVECARKVRATRRALFLPDSGAGDGTYWTVRPSAPAPMLTSASPFSPPMSLGSARLSPWKAKAEKMDVMLLVWRTNGKWAVQRVQCGRVKAKLGRKTKVCLPVALEKAMCEAVR